MSVEENLKVKKHVLLPWLAIHSGVVITRYNTVHDGKTVYQRIKNKGSGNKVLPFGQKFFWMKPKTITEGTSWIRFINSESSSVCLEQESSWF